MRLLVASREDVASLAQREALLRLAPWEPVGRFGGEEVLRAGDLVLLTIPDLHLRHDDVDRDGESVLGVRPEGVVFLSKHVSESRTRSLTVHPIGNFGAAAFGGRPRALVPTAPALMTETLRGIRREARDLGYAVTFEATHHGPYLETPAFFLEAGSTEAEWRDPRAAEALARALLSARPRPAPVGIGIGGGHYVPRLTDLALSRDVALGHLIPGYALTDLDDAALDAAVRGTPGATVAYFHRKALERSALRDLEARVAARGLRVVREDDLSPLPPEQSY